MNCSNCILKTIMGLLSRLLNNIGTNVLLDIFGIFIVVILLLSLLFNRKSKSKLKNIFAALLILVLLVLLLDETTWLLYEQDKYYFIFCVASYLSLFVMCLVQVAIFYIIIYFLKVDNKIMLSIVHLIMFVCAVIIVIPFLRNNVMTFEQFEVNFGPLFNPWIYSFVVVNIIITVIVIKYHKIIGRFNSITLNIFVFFQIHQAFGETKSEFTHAFFFISCCCLFFYLINYQIMSQEIQENKRQIDLQNEKIEKMQIQTLLLQIKPHFIFNALSSISNICNKDSELAKESINKFSLYLRANLQSLTSDDLIFFSKEIENVNNYLYIEKMRFQERLNIIYKIDEDDFKLPTLCLQPLVENAVKHGIMKKITGGTITISSSSNESNYIIIIEDDGVGFDLKDLGKMDESHVGIANVKKRLKLIINGDLTIDSEINKGTKVTIKIPKLWLSI